MKNSNGLMKLCAGFAVLCLLFAAGCSDDDKTPTQPTNHTPVISSVVVSPNSIGAGGTVTVTVMATDQDNDALTYAYAPNGGSISGNGSSVSWTAPSQAGSFSVSVTVSDGKGGSATMSGSLTVIASPTGITGTASATAGVNIDLRNSLVRLFDDITEFNNDLPVTSMAATGDEFSVSFSFLSLTPGTYYLDLWKDMDNSGTYTAGDLYGVYGTFNWPDVTPTQIIVIDGQTANIGNILLYEL